MSAASQSSALSRQTGIFCVLAAAILWGTTGTAQAFAPSGYDPKVIGAMRLLVGGGAFFAWAAWQGEFGRWRDWNWPVLACAAFFTASYQLCFFAAVDTTGVAAGTVVAIGSSPVFGGLLGRIFRGEELSGRWWMATMLAVCGCALLGFSGAALEVNAWGIVLAIGAGASYAAYTLFLKGLLARHPPTAVMALVACGGALLLSPALLRLDPAWLMQWRSVAVILHLGLASMALSYFFFARGLRLLPMSTAVTLTLAEPMTATILGLTVLGERLSGQSFAGVALIFTGLLVLIARLPKKKENL